MQLIFSLGHLGLSGFLGSQTKTQYSVPGLLAAQKAPQNCVGQALVNGAQGTVQNAL